MMRRSFSLTPCFSKVLGEEARYFNRFNGFHRADTNHLDKGQVLQAQHRSFSRSRWWLLWPIFLLLPRLAMAVLFYGTADPTRNTTAPTGALTNSGWQYQGTWGEFLGTPIAPKYFLTAHHVGGAVGDKFHFRDADYTTTAFFDDAGSDLRVWRICGTFPDYASLYSSSGEAGKTIVVFGRGTQRGVEVLVESDLTNSLKGWQWGPADGLQRWGTNVVTAIVTSASYGQLLKCNFDASGGDDEAHLSVGDSGGGVFLKQGAVWKLAGINLSVDGPYNTSTNGPGFMAAIFDEGGLYKGQEDNWTFIPDVPVDVPGSFYATRVSAHLSWISSVLQAPPPADPLPILQSSPSVTGPFQDVSSASIDTTTRTVTVSVPPDIQFYRLQACDPLHITSISITGANLVLTYE